MAENGSTESDELKAKKLKADFAKLHPPLKMNEALEQLIEDCRKHPEGLSRLKTFLNELIPWIQDKDSQAKSKRMRNDDGELQSSNPPHRSFSGGPQESWRIISWMGRRGWMPLSSVWRIISWMSRGGWMLLSSVLSVIPNDWVHCNKLKVHRIVTSETYGADDQIIKKLGKKLPLTLTGPADCAGVLLFCVANTRAGSDVDDAIETIPAAAKGKPVILVLMYHDYNKDCAVDRTDLSTQYKEVVLHVNVLFHQSKSGLLKCDRNDQAIKEIVNQCEQWIHET